MRLDILATAWLPLLAALGYAWRRGRLKEYAATAGTTAASVTGSIVASLPFGQDADVFLLLLLPIGLLLPPALIMRRHGWSKKALPKLGIYLLTVIAILGSLISVWVVRVGPESVIGG